MPPRRRRRYPRERAPRHGSSETDCESEEHQKRPCPSGSGRSHAVGSPGTAPPDAEQVRACVDAFRRVLGDAKTTPREKYLTVSGLISGGMHDAALPRAPVLHEVMRSRLQNQQKVKVVLKLVTECRVHPGIPDADGRLPLHIAAYEGLWQVMEAMVHHGADVSRHCTVREIGCAGSDEEFQPIHCAAFRGNFKVFRKLCDLGASLQGQSTPYGDYPVHMVCAYSSHPEEFLNYILREWPRCVTVTNNQGFNCLHCAIWGHNFAAATLLLHRHPELAGSFTQQEPRDENVSALMLAIQHMTTLSRGHDDVKMVGLIARQVTCDIGARGSRGTSALEVLLKTRSWNPHILAMLGKANPDYAGLGHAERNFVQAEIASARRCRDSGTLPRIPFVSCGECDVVLRTCFLAIENYNFGLAEDVARYLASSYRSPCSCVPDGDYFVRHCIRAGNSAAVDHWTSPLSDAFRADIHDASFVALAVEHERHLILHKLLRRDYAYPIDTLHRMVAKIPDSTRDAEIYGKNLRHLFERGLHLVEHAQGLNLAHVICQHSNRTVLAVAVDSFPEFGDLVTTASGTGRLPIHYALDQLDPDLGMLRRLWSIMVDRGWVAAELLELRDEDGRSLLCTIAQRNACDGAWHWMREITEFGIHDVARSALGWVSSNPRGGSIARMLMRFAEIRCHARDDGTLLHSCHRQRNVETARAIAAETCTHLAAASGEAMRDKSHDWVVLTLSDVLGWRALPTGATPEHSPGEAGDAGDSEDEGTVLWLVRNECVSPRAALESAIVMGRLSLLRALLSLELDAWCPEECQREPIPDTVAYAHDVWQELQPFYNMQNERLSVLLDSNDCSFCCESCRRAHRERDAREHEQRRRAALNEWTQLARGYLRREKASVASRAYLEHRRSTAQMRLMFRHLRATQATARKFGCLVVRLGLWGRLASMKAGLLDHPRNLSAIHKWARGCLKRRLGRSEEQATKLGTELEDLSDTFMCMICTEGHRDVTYLCNGFHTVYCRECFDKMSTLHGTARSCPICRQDVTQVAQRNRGIIAEFGQHR